MYTYVMYGHRQFRAYFQAPILDLLTPRQSIEMSRIIGNVIQQRILYRTNFDLIQFSVRYRRTYCVLAVEFLLEVPRRQWDVPDVQSLQQGNSRSKTQGN